MAKFLTGAQVSSPFTLKAPYGLDSRSTANTVEDESNDAATLYLDEQNSNDNKKIYIKKGLDRDGNIHDLYKIEVNSDGTGIWYCINQRSDLHELETFFKLIGADDLGSAKSILSNTNIGDENNIINVLNDPEIKQQVLVLEDVSINHVEVIGWLREYIKEGMQLWNL